MDFRGLVPSQNERHYRAPSFVPFIRDNLHVTTWLCVGAVIQSAAFLAIGRLAFIPAAGLIVYRILEAYAITTGLKHNPYMENVINEKTSAQPANSQGQYGNKASNSDIAVLLLGTQCNHPMGMFAPGFKELGDHFDKMNNDLRANAAENGFLGMTSYIATERSTNNQLLNVMYFKNSDAIHAFAEGPVHRDGWNWWTKLAAQYPHIMIFHELYHVPKGYWETIYQHASPTCLGATSMQVEREKGVDGEEGGKVWVSPVVSAAKGVLANSAGRMGRGLSEKV